MFGMRSRQRVLITNIQLTARTGTEHYVRDLALELLHRGHEPMIYSPRCGATADQLRAATIPVFDDLSKLDAVPDVIHAHHTLEAGVAALRFPGVPIVFVSHSSTGWFDQPPRLSAVKAHIAVDEAVRDRLVLVEGVEDDDVRIIHNGIDLARFTARTAPLPERPRRALVFSNYTANGPWVDAVVEAWRRAGLHLDVAGMAPATPLERPEEVLREYDLVFGKARCAMEALAVGCAVVVCDSTGVAGMVHPDNITDHRRLNFGVRTMIHPHTPEVLDAAIADYNPLAAAEASNRYRAVGGLTTMVDELLETYKTALADMTEPDHDGDGRRLAELFGQASSDRWNLDHERWRVGTLGVELEAMRAEAEAARDAERRLAGFEALNQELHARRAALEADVDALVAERDRAVDDLTAVTEDRDAIIATRTWRLRRSLLSIYQRLRRLDR
jgi:hypothetical protein